MQTNNHKVKLIRQEKFIRFSGIVMMISPFVNFTLSIAPVQNVGDKTSLPVLWHLAKSINGIHWVLWAASFVVGMMMLKGRRSSWISVLAILGIFIVFDFLNIKKNLARGWEQPLTSIAFNLFIFVLVYVQEFRQSTQPRPKAVPKPKPVETPVAVKPVEPPKPKTPNPVFEWIRNVKMPEIKLPEVKLPAPKPKPVAVASPTPPPAATPVLQSRAAPKQEIVQADDFRVPKLPNLIGHVIHFDGMGPWARIVNLDERELYLRGFREPPPALTSRAVEIDIGQETYRMRMTSRQGQLYTFRFEAVQKFKLRLVS